MIKSKKERTILSLGPPHSGKSVFSYILFKYLRKLGDDAFVMDGDYYSPTYRRVRIDEFVSPEEDDYIITTPNKRKLTKLTEETFHNQAHSIHAAIEAQGFIILDGIGRHSYSTESLLELADILIVLCPSQFCVETGSKECGYIKDGVKCHPFLFYSGIKDRYIKINTHFHGDRNANFNEDTLEAELYDLDIGIINKGNIDRIPLETRETIFQIAEYILSNYK